MNQSRRKFIKLSGAMGTGIAFSSLTGLALNSCGGQKIDKFGLGLYTLRDDLPKDPKAVLTEVAAAGYKQIESYEGPLGIFWGMGHTGFKKLMDDLGMTIVASHADINKDFETKAAQAAEIGMKYLLSPWLGPQKTLDDYKKAAETFNQKAEICKKNGIRFGYHNHDYTFIPLEGQMPQDILMSNTDPSLVDFELDIYWIVTAGQDPEA
ncbi:MAG TPA: sugar phosphate isomerase/epimerase, partial [Chitinophagaceae bacterium]|nr:sugar phosphate isomerase/epimerase [Chitinophagaceae bacterium]